MSEKQTTTIINPTSYGIETAQRERTGRISLHFGDAENEAVVLLTNYQVAWLAQVLHGEVNIRGLYQAEQEATR